MRLRGSVAIEHTLARLGAERLWKLLHPSAYVAGARRADRQPGGAEVKAGLKAIYLAAGRSPPTPTSPARRTPTRACIPRTAVPAVVRAHQQRAAAAPTRSTSPKGDTAIVLVRADRRRRRGGLRRAAQRVRADEGDDRGGRGGRALRGPALVREEVRTPGRQGARADERSSSGRSQRRGWRPTCCGVPTVLVARTDADSAALLTSDVDRARPTRSSRASARRRASSSSGRGSRPRSRAAVRTRRTPTCLVRDVDARPGRGARSSPRRSTSSSRASCSPTTARRRSTGRRSSTTTRSRGFQRELGAMGYKFQFVTLAGFHALNAAMFELAHGYARRGA